MRYKKLAYIKVIDIVWYFPILMALILSFTTIGVTSVDSGMYIKKAFFFSQGLIDWHVRPGFIFLLGSAFKIFGPSVWAATVVVRFFFFAEIVLLFLMANYLFNKKVAFVTTALLLSSYSLNRLSNTVTLDNIHPFFVLTAIFLSILAIDKQSTKFAVFAGLTFGYAYLIKCTAILFFPFPLLLVIVRNGISLNFKELRKAIVVSGIAGSCVVIYSFALRFGEAVSLGEDQLNYVYKDFFGMFNFHSVLQTCEQVCYGLFNFWENFFFQDTLLGVLFIAAWCWLGIRSVRSINSRSIFLVFLMFLPAMFYLGVFKYRFGQAGIFLFVTYIPMAVMLFDFSGYCSRFIFPGKLGESSSYSPRSSIFIILLTIMLSTYQIWYVASDRIKSFTILKYTTLFRFISGKDTTWRLIGTFDQDSKQAGELLLKVASPGATVATGFKNRWAIDFYTGYQYEVNRFASPVVVVPSTLKTGFTEKIPTGRGNELLSGKSKILYMWPNLWKNQLDFWSTSGKLKIRYLDEELLRWQFSDDKLPVYVVLDKRYAHLNEYLRRASGAISLNVDSTIFQFKSFGLVENFIPHIATDISMILSTLKTKNYYNYQQLMIRLPTIFSLTPAQVEAIGNHDEKNNEIVLFEQ